MVTVNGAEGQFGVFSGHAPMMTTLRPGMLDIVVDQGERQRVFVRGGFAEVNALGLTILAEEAIPESQLKPDVVAQRITDAEEDLADAKDDDARRSAREELESLKEIQRALG